MVPNTKNLTGLWQEDPFGIIRPEEYDDFGINSGDIPPGTVAARRHPPLLSSRYGGNAYGFGFFEISDRLDKKDLNIIQSIDFNSPDNIKAGYRKINQIYKKISLLIRFTSFGTPYYLIPNYLLSTSLANIKNKSDEISKIIGGHRKKYFQESHKIGILTHKDDPVVDDLALRFKEHEFITIDSQEKLRDIDETLDLVIITRDLYRTVQLEMSLNRSMKSPTKTQLENYIIYMLYKIYEVLKSDGEIFIIAKRHRQKTDETAVLTFNTAEEEKNFFIFTHIFKTEKKYSISESPLKANIYDFERYLEQEYVDHELIEKLLKNRTPDTLSLEDIESLPFLNIPLSGRHSADQEKSWSKPVSIFFNEIFLKPLVPESVKAEWEKRFTIEGYSPGYLLICLAQKKEIPDRITLLKDEISQSPLAGCPLSLLAEYRDSFDYLIRTLAVLKEIKNNTYRGLPESYLERIREPFESKKMRYKGVTQVIKLLAKINRLRKIKEQLNPDKLDGNRTKVLKNIEILSLFGFTYEELKEIFLIVAGHTTGGRIVAGKMSEKTLKPVTDLARAHSPLDAINLLRYCRLMTMAEVVASRRTDMDHVQVIELFNLFESALRVTTTREPDWETHLDEKISAMGGIHNKLVHKLLMMMKLFEFIDTWAELGDKGAMEKESLADYDAEKFARIENIINLVDYVDYFEKRFLGKDPLQVPIIYRKILNMEFHGTGYLFERMSSRLVYVLLWFTVNVTRGSIINFNPILGDSLYSEFAERVKKVEEEALAINTKYLSPEILGQFSEQLLENELVFILNTGFKISLSNNGQSLDITYIDIDSTIERLELLCNSYREFRVSDIPLERLEDMERLLSDLEDFYQSHQRFLDNDISGMSIPKKQGIWINKITELRQVISIKFSDALFSPESLYTDLVRLFHHSPTILELVLPELNALRNLGRSGHLYRKSAVIDHLLTCAKKFQALVNGNLKDFQDVDALHKLARREFGPNVAGIVGLNETQVEELAVILKSLRENGHLFDALIKTFIFQDIGMSPDLRKKYFNEINIADQAQAGTVFIKGEGIPEKYGMSPESEGYLLSLIAYHDRMHHIIRGEYTLHSIKEILDTGDSGLFNAFFLSSLVMISALGEDQILEDLANRLFILRDLCLRIISGEAALEKYLEKITMEKGRVYFAIEEYHRKGLPENVSGTAYLNSWGSDFPVSKRFTEAGNYIFSLERIFKLRGLRYVDFADLARMIVQVPLKFIYRQKKYYSVGYATFERDLYEAYRVYNYINRLPEAVRYFILKQLGGDNIRIFGYENVSFYLSYDNQMKLLLISLLGSKRCKSDERPVCLNFLSIMEKIDKRYEAVNDTLNNISFENIWYERKILNQFFKAKTGIILEKDEHNKVLSVHFQDKLNISRRISHLEQIEDIEQLKNYFHYSLQSFRKNNYFTDDYESLLEQAFEKRLNEIIDKMLEQVKRRMMMAKDFREVHTIFLDLMNRSLEIGFNEDQVHRLNDLYDLCCDSLRREKLDEVNGLINEISNEDDLRDYWNSIKWYLFNNRQFLGKELESMIARNFDEALFRISSEGN